MDTIKMTGLHYFSCKVSYTTRTISQQNVSEANWKLHRDGSVNVVDENTEHGSSC